MLLLGIIWPIEPTSQAHPVGNSWGEYQNYSGDTADSYFHPGVDVMGVSQGKPVYAVAHGWVKAWTTIYADYHWRIATSDQNTDDWSDGWLYAHIDPYRWHAQLGDEVQEGDLIGYLVPWPVQGFDHLHFARIRHHGSNWNDAAWLFIRNPLVDLEPSADTSKPKVEDVGVDPGCFLAFKRDRSQDYLRSDSLFGQVDVVLKAYDSYGMSWGYPTYERIGVYKIEWRVDTGAWTLAFLFRDTLYWDNTAELFLVYNYDNRLQTCGDYGCREFYYVITNTDGAGRPAESSWNTTELRDGPHWFAVRLTDEAGNQAVDSCLVYTYNGNSAVEEGASPSRGGLVYDAAGRFLGKLERGLRAPRSGVFFVIEGRKVKKLLRKEGEALY